LGALRDVQVNALKRFLYIIILCVPPLLVAAYAAFLIWVTWPIGELSIGKSGVFGDSFGVLNALFSGLAFSILIVTVLLQREELRLQREELKENREELKRSANAQELSARLNALTALFSEYRSLAESKEEELLRALMASGKIPGAGMGLVNAVKKERDLVLTTKYKIFRELEKMAGLEMSTQPTVQADGPASGGPAA
jgi:phosphotransferase system  glucose/maltose/N-acetylglucosamine-specific IIC component